MESSSSPHRPAERQRPPGDAQFDTERRLVGAVPADVADHGVHRAVGRADGVVEVTAEQRAGAARAVAGRETQRGAVQERRREQAALQAGVLLGAQPGLGELALGDVGAPALDGVAHRTAQQAAVQLVAEQIVLGTDAHGLGAALRVAGRGESEDGVPRREAQDVPERLQLVGVRGRAGRGQGEVEQDAVDVVGEESLGLGEVAGGTDADRLARRVGQFGHAEGGGGVVLDDEERQRATSAALGAGAVGCRGSVTGGVGTVGA